MKKYEKEVIKGDFKSDSDEICFYKNIKPKLRDSFLKIVYSYV